MGANDIKGVRPLPLQSGPPVHTQEEERSVIGEWW
jgi:hypothetical protein